MHRSGCNHRITYRIKGLSCLFNICYHFELFIFSIVFFVLEHVCTFISLCYCLWLGPMLRYKVVLDSDAEQYHGHKRVDPCVEYHTIPEAWDNRINNMHVRNLKQNCITWFIFSSCYWTRLAAITINYCIELLSVWLIIYLLCQLYTRYKDREEDRNINTCTNNEPCHTLPAVKSSGKGAKPSLTIIPSCNKLAVCIRTSLKCSLPCLLLLVQNLGIYLVILIVISLLWKIWPSQNVWVVVINHKEKIQLSGLL